MFIQPSSWITPEKAYFQHVFTMKIVAWFADPVGNVENIFTFHISNFTPCVMFQHWKSFYKFTAPFLFAQSNRNIRHACLTRLQFCAFCSHSWRLLLSKCTVRSLQSTHAALYKNLWPVFRHTELQVFRRSLKNLSFNSSRDTEPLFSISWL